MRISRVKLLSKFFNLSGEKRQQDSSKKINISFKSISLTKSSLMPSLAVSSYTLDQFQPWLTTDQRFSILNSTIRWFPTANNPAIPLPQFRTFAKQRNNEYPEYPFEQRKRNIETKKKKFRSPSHSRRNAWQFKRGERSESGHGWKFGDGRMQKEGTATTANFRLGRVVLDSHRQHKGEP